MLKLKLLINKIEKKKKKSKNPKNIVAILYLNYQKKSFSLNCIENMLKLPKSLKKS